MHILTIPGVHFHGLAYTPDGGILLTGDSKGMLSCWNLSTFTESLQVPFSNYPVRSVSFSTDGQLLACEGKIYHATELLQAARKPYESGGGPQRFGKDNIDSLLPRVLLENNWSQYHGAVLSPRCEIAAPFGPYNQPGLWDREGHWLRSLALDGLRHAPALGFSPDARLLAVCEYHTLLIIDTATTTVKATLQHPQSVENVVFLPDGRLLATSSGPVVRLWDLTTYECVECYKGSRGRIASLVLHPGGRLLMGGGVGGVIRFWDMTTRRELPSRDWRIGTIHGLAFAPDGQTAAAAGHQGVMIWDVDDV